MQANLSRIHHIIKYSIEEFVGLSNRICNMRLEFNFSVLEKTEEADFHHFLEKLAKRRQEYYALSRKMDKLLAYADYLKMEIAAANEKYGIGALLARASSLGRKIRHLENVLELVREKHALDLSPIMPMDYYKSAFTERERSYSLAVYLFDENDLEDLRREHRKLLDDQQAINDKIAELNQSNILDILTFDEFAEKKPDNITV